MPMLRHAVTAFFAERDGVWRLRAQLRINAETMPVEDTSVAWPNAESPYVPVARLVPQQPHSGGA